MLEIPVPLPVKVDNYQPLKLVECVGGWCVIVISVYADFVATRTFYGV